MELNNKHEPKEYKPKLESRYKNEDQDPDNSTFLLFMLILFISIYFLFFKCN